MKTWREYIIGDFGKILTGTTPSTKITKYYGGPYKFISPVDLDNGKYITTSHKLLTKEGLSVGRVLPKNSILIGCIGNIGKIGMTKDEISSFNQQINAVICNEDFLPDFIYYLLLNNRHILEKSAVKTTVPILNKGNFENIKLKAPILSEQKKIAYVLSIVQNGIECLDKLIQKTTELKKALLQKLFEEGVNEGKWKIVELGEYSEIRTSFPTLKKVVSSFSKDNGKYQLHFLKVSDMNLNENEKYFNVSNNIFFTDDLKDFKTGVLRPESLVFPKRGAAISTNKKRITSKYSILDPNLIGVEPSHKIEIGYLFYFFELFDLTSLQDNNVIPQLNKHNVASIKIPLPDAKDQISIVKTLDVISKKLNILKSKKKVLLELFKSLLHELMTGQIKVDEIEFEELKAEHKT